ncbi:hypothetical protein EG68_06900 [Paragonimus skrjabini miyazakii]|uniref:Uncharacterized protein n=1 Tax=Paragonimus skrjabini miyazakii TaxID=59628 RepID=A0A8S9YLH8_9TREM|nr:hypothetical protein EG68_06900 [Paragonimus skrjabini miyazakii]
MTSKLEIFSFPLEILKGPSGERNFEMYRAEQIYQLPDLVSDLCCDPLVWRSPDLFEVNFEMIHMVGYMRKIVDPSVFDCWPSPIFSAEYWLHKLSQQVSPQDTGISSLPVQTSKMEISYLSQDEIIASHTENNQKPLEHTTGKPKLHRRLPGFNTILQCGATVLGDDSVLPRSVVSPASYKTPTSERINRMFEETVTGCKTFDSRYELEASLAEKLKENTDDYPPNNQSSHTGGYVVVPGSVRNNAPTAAQTEPKVNWSQWLPLVESTNVINSNLVPKPINPLAAEANEKTLGKENKIGMPPGDGLPSPDYVLVPKSECISKSSQSTAAPAWPKWRPLTEFTSVANTASFETKHANLTGRPFVEAKPKSAAAKPVVTSHGQFEIFHDSFVQSVTARHTVTESVAVTAVSNSISASSKSTTPVLLNANPMDSPSRVNIGLRKTSSSKPPKVTTSLSDVERLNDTAIFELLDQQLAIAHRSRGGPSVNSVFSFDSPTRMVEQMLQNHTKSKSHR